MKLFCENDERCPSCRGGLARPTEVELVDLGPLHPWGPAVKFARCDRCKGRGSVCSAGSAVEGCGATAAFCTGAPSPTGSTPTRRQG